MPKSYELKLREAEERRRPRPTEELYKAIEGESQKLLMGFDHPETLELEMQLTWVQDTYTIDQTHAHLMSETLRLDAEYRRKPLRCNYIQKYLWYDRMMLRPKVKGRELTLQDYNFQPGCQMKMTPFYTSENVWGQPQPFWKEKERKPDDMQPCVDPKMLVRLDSVIGTPKTRVFVFPWLGGSVNDLKEVAKRMPQDLGFYGLDPPGRTSREDEEAYPTGEFAIEAMTLTLAKEMQKPGANFIFAHGQGAHFAYYVAKRLIGQHNVRINGVFVSNSAVPMVASLDITDLRARYNLCVPMRVLTGLIKGGYGVDPALGYKSHMGWLAYQGADNWPKARTSMMDWWSTKEFPLPRADEPLRAPIAAFRSQEDPTVAMREVEQWKALSNNPSSFEVVQVSGEHLWFLGSLRAADALATELGKLVKKFA